MRQGSWIGEILFELVCVVYKSEEVVDLFGKHDKEVGLETTIKRYLSLDIDHCI